VNPRDFAQLALLIAGLVAITPPLANSWPAYSQANAISFRGRSGPMECGIYKLSGVDPAQEMSWKMYMIAMFAFNIVGGILLLALETPLRAIRTFKLLLKYSTQTRRSIARRGASRVERQVRKTTKRSRRVGPRVFDKPSPKRRQRLIMDGRFACAVCFVSAQNVDPLQALAYRDGERLLCQQFHVRTSDEYDHDRFHT
jgi:hypothetical protein